MTTNAPKGTALPNHASQLVSQSSKTVIDHWESRANAEVSAAFGLESLALRESLHLFLSQLAGALSKDIESTASRVKQVRTETLRIGQKHGHERASTSTYTMDQTLFEYQILRQVLLKALDDQINLTTSEREVIVCAIEHAVNAAATLYSEKLRGNQEELIASSTDDLRGPITSAKISAQMLLRRPDDINPCIKVASRISKKMDRLDSMISAALDIKLIRTGQSYPHHQEALEA